MNKLLMTLALAILLAACEKPVTTADKAAAPSGKAAMSEQIATTSLATILAAQPEATQARYVYRHPQETLEFFGIQPGTTVVEALPGRGWYSKILLAYLGPDGHLIGADYPMDMWPMFGIFDDEYIDGKKTWSYDWPLEAEEWRDEDSATVSAFVFGSRPDDLDDKADAVLFIRALHNLGRFESKGGFLTAAIADAYAVLKPGGIVGVVQHQARDEMPDEWADGSRGYLKKDALIARFENAGFEFVADSDINANPKDQPTEDDFVWRLPPSYVTSREDAELHAKMEAIGESNRMTLKFKKR